MSVLHFDWSDFGRYLKIEVSSDSDLPQGAVNDPGPNAIWFPDDLAKHLTAFIQDDFPKHRGIEVICKAKG